MVEVMQTVATSFKRPHAHTATLRAPIPAAGHRQPTPLPRLQDTHGQAWARLLWGPCFFLWVLALTRFCLCPPRVCSPGLCTFWRLYGGLTETSSKRASAMPRSTAPRGPAPAAVHCRPARPQETPKHSSVSGSVGSLSPGAHNVCLSPLSIAGRHGV